jgi:hypothetical protein
MALVLDKSFEFDLEDNAIVWGDENNQRFRLIIPRTVLIDHFGLTQYFDERGAREKIKENWGKIEEDARAAFERGTREHTYQG